MADPVQPSDQLSKALNHELILNEVLYPALLVTLDCVGLQWWKEFLYVKDIFVFIMSESLIVKDRWLARTTYWVKAVFFWLA